MEAKQKEEEHEKFKRAIERLWTSKPDVEIEREEDLDMH
jgi:hypothetical protein